MKNNNIIIISDDIKSAKKFADNIVLLRSYDHLQILNKDNCFLELENQYPDLIMLHIKRDKDIEIINRLKQMDNIKRTSIIVLIEQDDKEILCSAFDAGVDDYMNINTDDTEAVMRIMWGLKKKYILDNSAKKSDILDYMEVTDKASGFYNKKYTQKIFEREYKNIIKSGENAIFMVISSDLSDRNNLTQRALGDVLQKVIRTNDIVGFTTNDRFYMLLFNTTEIGAKTLFDRINQELNNKATVSAAAITISNCKDKSFNETEKFLAHSMGKALLKSNSFIFEKDFKQPVLSFDNSSILNNKNNGNIKNIFLAKTEKIILPLFFKMQAIYEPKLFNTKFFQVNNDKESRFFVQSKNYASEISILYGDYSRLTVEIKNTFKGNSNIQKVIFEKEDFTSEKIEDIMQNVLENFRNIIYNNEEEVL